MRSARLLAVVAIGLTVSATTARPRIGLALSGGGARGFAHLGVLEYFEQNHIPIDCIAGTSMGGLVGAMYAAGLTTPQMRKILADIDWAPLFRDAPPYSQLAYRRKEDQQSFPSGLEIGLRRGVTLPSGVIEGQKIGLLLSRLTMPVAHITDFDQLPVPFRCVATDMLNGQPVVLRRGSLAQALRATIAIPGVFTPVEMDGRVLADGGLLNNLPTDVVKDMGADIVIAVDIGTPLGDREAIRTLVGMVGQSIAVMIVQNVQRNLRLADIIISPELEGYSAADFTACTPVAKRGYQGAAAKAAVLKPLAIDAPAYADYDTQRRRIKPEPFVPDRVEVTGVTGEPKRQMEQKLGGFAGRPLDTTVLDQRLASFFGTGYFARIDYATTRQGNQSVLRVRVQPKSYGPPYLRLHGDLLGGSSETVRFNLRGRVTVTGLTGYGSEWRNDLGVGDATQLLSEYHHPFGGSPFFMASRISYHASTSDLFAGNQRAAEYRTRDMSVGADLGLHLGTKGRLAGGLAYGGVRQNVSLGPALRPSVRDTVAYSRVQLTLDTRNSSTIPTRGTWLDTELRWYLRGLGGTSDLTRLRGQVYAFQPVGRRDTVWFGAGGGAVLSGATPPYAEFTLGGLMHLNAYRRDRFRGAGALHGQAGWMHQFAALPFYLGGRVYATGMYEVGSTFARADRARYQSSGTFGVMADTLLGPAFLGYSIGEHGNQQVHFSLGRLF